MQLHKGLRLHYKHATPVTPVRVFTVYGVNMTILDVCAAEASYSISSSAQHVQTTL